MPDKNILKNSLELLQEQRKALFGAKSDRQLEPLEEGSYPTALFSREQALGVKLIKEGRVACIVLAGGQGTRLGWSGPKALYPIVPHKRLTLLQILLEKVHKASDEYGVPLRVAVMTSTLSHEQFERDAERNDFYGLEKGQLTFFAQNALPLLDDLGNWFYEKPGQLALGPDGNGSLFCCLQQSGLLDHWKNQNIESIIVLQVDNPLADPFDSFLIHALKNRANDVVAKTIERIDAEEQIGVFARCNGKLCVAEYSEIEEEVKRARKIDGRFLFPYANIGVFAFSLSFVEKMASVQLPWHIARKKAWAWGMGEIECAKCETFIFDVLPFADRSSLLLDVREKCYAPLKNKEGDKSPGAVLSKISHLI